MDRNNAATHSRSTDSRTPVTQRTSTQREACSRVPCRYFSSQTGCHRGKDCWFLHDIASNDTSSTSSHDLTDTSSQQTAASPESCATSEDEKAAPLTCGICFDPPTKFGLMDSCSHVFCLVCIRKWRNREGKTEETVIEGMHKTCPTCRTHSKYVIPSSVFFAHATPEKQAEIDKYLSNTARIPCRHFNHPHSRARFCPFGNECHYAHNVNGSRYIFSPGELARMREQRERRAMQQQTAAMLEGLMAEEGAWGAEENEAFVWDILHGLMEHEHLHHLEDELFGRRGQWWSDDEDDDDEDYEEDEDDEDEEDDDYFDEDDDSDDIPDLIDDDDDEDDLPDLIDDEDDIPDLVDDTPDDLPPLVDDDVPPLVDDDHTSMADDELPPLIDDVPDDLPALVDITPPQFPNPRTREDWGPTNAQNDESNRHPQISINGPSLSSPSPTRQAANTNPLADNPRPISNPRRRQNPPSVSLPRVEGTSSVAPGFAPVPAPFSQSQAAIPPIRIPAGTIPSSRVRRFTPPQHIPPPGPRRPRPPRSRTRDTSRPRYVPGNAPRAPPPPPDEYGWDDDDGTTDGEVSERERQRTRDSDERGINARNWDSRASDLSYFRSL